MSDRRYSTAAWQKLRRAVLARDGGYCTIQGPRCTVYATTVDHVLPSSTHPHLFWEPSNLRPPAAAATSAQAPPSQPRTLARRSSISAPS